MEIVSGYVLQLWISCSRKHIVKFCGGFFFLWHSSRKIKFNGSKWPRIENNFVNRQLFSGFFVKVFHNENTYPKFFPRCKISLRPLERSYIMEMIALKKFFYEKTLSATACLSYQKLPLKFFKNKNFFFISSLIYLSP